MFKRKSVFSLSTQHSKLSTKILCHLLDEISTAGYSRNQTSDVSRIASLLAIYNFWGVKTFMNGQQLITALRAGQPVYGTMILSPSPLWPGAVKRLGLDMVFIDTEHIPQDRSTVSWMCQTYRALDLAPVVRIPEPNPFLAQMAYDGGAAGVIAPYIETPEQVVALGAVAKYGPLKGEKLRAFVAGETQLEPELADYLGERAAQKALIINIESVPALNRLDEILSVPTVDAVLVGPHDLSLSLGIPEQYDHPDFDVAIRHIIRTARAHGIGVGIHIDAMPLEIAWAQAGANLIMHSSDIVSFTSRLTDDFNHLRGALQQASAVEQQRINI
jgi:2-keto-3-deoxy-L-rhamnonate aldolase RhmA